MAEGTATIPTQIDEFQLGAILDGVPARVALLGRDGRYLYVNKECLRFADQPRDAIIGRTMPEVLGEAAFQAMREFGERALVGETVQWEGWLPYAEGKDPRYVQRVCMPYQTRPGTIDGYLIFVWDLTEHRRGEQLLMQQTAALEMSQALGAAMIASALDCVIIIDEDGCVVEFNPAAERVFGHARGNVLGLPIGDIIVPEYLRARHARGFARYLATGEAHALGKRLQIEGVRANGEIFPVELTITEVRLPDRRLFTAYLRDLTAARAAAAEIERSREALHQSEKMAAFGSLLAGVAHELNNPLSIVVGNAMMLADDAASDASPLASRAGKIQVAAERCARIVRAFLAMGREKALVMRSFPVRPLVTEALEMLGHTLRNAGVSVDVAIPAALPEALGDPDGVTQVVVNLIANAQQALMVRAPPRRIALAAASKGTDIILSVADNGPGVPPELRSRIFDPFFTTKPLGAGTGIGLTVCRGILEAHKGSLSLTTSADGGAEFTIRLRAASVGEVTAPIPGSPRAATAAHSSSLTALIVDDQPDVAEVLAEIMNAFGYCCETAHSGAAACAALERRDVDLILCDLHMPDVDGASVFEWLKHSKPHLCEVFCFLTGDTLTEPTRQFLAGVGQPVLEKPFVPRDVSDLIARLHGPGVASATAAV